MKDTIAHVQSSLQGKNALVQLIDEKRRTLGLDTDAKLARFVGVRPDSIHRLYHCQQMKFETVYKILDGLGLLSSYNARAKLEIIEHIISSQDITPEEACQKIKKLLIKK
jgi:hypothetical protein